MAEKLSAPPRCFAYVSEDTDVLDESSSGGAFTQIASLFLSKGGAVYGCAFDKHQVARHIRTTDKNSLTALRNSKYVQSDMGSCFAQVRADLEEGRWVCFSGTPCQVDGLLAFLLTTDVLTEKLLCVDLVCHGVPSPALWGDYLDVTFRRRGKLKRVLFRDKAQGWGCGGGVFLSANGRDKKVPLVAATSSYYHHFLSGITYRESCYVCPYARKERISDVTIGDFWGIENTSSRLDRSRGVSLIIASSEKGLSFVLEAFGGEYLEEHTIDEAARGNSQLNQPMDRAPIRDEIMTLWLEQGAAGLERAFRRKHIASILVWHAKHFVKKVIGRT